jgi:feruloyl-CoA synthase
MLLVNQQQLRQVWPFLNSHSPVLVDWLPWSHTFGGSYTFNLALCSGGTFYIDAGRPLPQLFDQTITNLRDIAPTLYFNVPRAYEMLVPALRGDAKFRTHFFSRLQFMFCAAAALPQHIFEALRELAAECAPGAVRFLSAWGSTETAPMSTSCHFPTSSSGVIGLPVPGVELKLVPRGPKLEVRVRGPNVMREYWKRPDLTEQAFDEEGFYLIGDAVRPVDRNRFELGLLFDGRVAEDFKLSTGTWVNAGAIRLNAIVALAPLVQDVVVSGHDRDSVVLLLFPNVAACRQICDNSAGVAPLGQVLADQRIRDRIRQGLRELRRYGTGSSTYASRALLMSEPASIDAGEVTDKGYINQRAVLERRKALVDALFAASPDTRVISVDDE